MQSLKQTWLPCARGRGFRVITALLISIGVAGAHAGECTGNCCRPNGTPGCKDPACCAAVCAADSFCCDTEWDALCVETAIEVCAIDCGSPCTESSNDCCVPNRTIGCQNPACCAVVCAFDPFCCTGAWDAICAGEAAVLCDDACAPCVAADTDANQRVDVDDLVNVILDWGTDGLGRNTDVDLDGEVALGDLMTVIALWGDCPAAL